MARLIIPGFVVPGPPTDFDRIGYPWLLAYWGGARRPLWWRTGRRMYGVLLPRWVKVKYGLGGDDAGHQRIPGAPNA